MTALAISIPMAPMGKARPRVVNGNAYMPPAYREWKEQFAGYVYRQLGDQRVTGEFYALVIFITRTGNSRSDLDNSAGACLDALQDAYVIRNDRDCKGLMTAIAKGQENEIRIVLQAVSV